tara:strand:+ start:194 stop:388 length:195 start_codon:yes stop_codon:yes gene_type:complete
MALDKITKFKDIRALISLQLQYLSGLKREYLDNGEKNYHSPNNAGFFRISIELNKQIQKLKNNN